MRESRRLHFSPRATYISGAQALLRRSGHAKNIILQHIHNCPIGQDRVAHGVSVHHNALFEIRIDSSVRHHGRSKVTRLRLGRLAQDLPGLHGHRAGQLHGHHRKSGQQGRCHADENQSPRYTLPLTQSLTHKLISHVQ